jgi:hypothetical protein
MDMIVEKVNKYYLECFENQNTKSKDNNIGGKIRFMRGDMVENIAKIVITGLITIFSTKLSIKKGNDDKIEIVSKSGYIKKQQTDIHVRYDGKLIFVIECKSYLDSCYYVRATDDCRLFKIYDKNIKFIVLTLEDSANENTKLFTDDTTDNPIDAVFYLVDGKRQSSKPIYKKEYFKPINKIKLYDCIYSLSQIVEQHISSLSSKL